MHFEFLLDCSPVEQCIWWYIRRLRDGVSIIGSIPAIGAVQWKLETSGKCNSLPQNGIRDWIIGVALTSLLPVSFAFFFSRWWGADTATSRVVDHLRFSYRVKQKDGREVPWHVSDLHYIAARPTAQPISGEHANSWTQRWAKFCSTLPILIDPLLLQMSASFMMIRQKS